MPDLEQHDNESLFAPLLANGRNLLTLGTLGLFFAGGFAIFLSATGQFLPHDVEFLGMTSHDLCNRNACSIVHFMIHDRASFGGTLLSLSVLYLWLIHFPLRNQERWAWWTLLFSNVIGFSSFLTYLGFGYLDTWHLVATLFLLPCFTIGLALTFRTLENQPSNSPFRKPAFDLREKSIAGRGRLLLLVSAAGLLGAGFVITLVGMTVVFVPQDLQYMQTTVPRLDAINPRLIPLIAHDRTGFGSCVFNNGFLVLSSLWYGRLSRHQWQALAIALSIGFTAAIGVHPLVGYNNPVHLAPACAGAICFFIGLAMTRPGTKLSAREQ
jgi:hypothetical protein